MRNTYIFFYPFLHYFQSSRAPKVSTPKVIGQIFFNELALKNWALNEHFNPIPILSGLFLERGGAWGINENRCSLENISTFPLATASKSSVKQTTLTSKTKNC